MHMHELEAGGAPSERHGPAQPLARGAQQFTQHGLAGTIDWCTGPPRLSAEVSDGIQARVQRAARGCALQQPRAAQHDQDCQRRQRPPGHARGLMRSQCAQQGPWCGSPQALALDSLRSVAVRNRPAPCPFPVQSRGCACGVGRPQGSPGLSSSGPPFVMAARGARGPAHAHASALPSMRGLYLALPSAAGHRARHGRQTRLSRALLLRELRAPARAGTPAAAWPPRQLPQPTPARTACGR